MIVHNRAQLHDLGISANTLVSVQRSVDGFAEGSAHQMPFSAVLDWMQSQGLTFRGTNLNIIIAQRGGLGLDYRLDLGQYVPNVNVSGLPATAYGIAQSYPLTAAAVGAAAMGYHPMQYAENLLEPLNVDVPSFGELVGLPIKTLRQLASTMNIPGRSSMNKQQLAGSLRSAWRT